MLDILCMVIQVLFLYMGQTCPQDQPPIGIAYDGGTGHVLLNHALLGLLHPKELQNIAFFKHCKPQRIDLPAFDFKCLYYKDVGPVLGCQDPFHALKRLTCHLNTAARCIQLGDVFVDLTPLLERGLSARAYSCVDIQSDRDMALKVNPGHLGGESGLWSPSPRVFFHNGWIYIVCYIVFILNRCFGNYVSMPVGMHPKQHLISKTHIPQHTLLINLGFPGLMQD